VRRVVTAPEPSALSDAALAALSTPTVAVDTFVLAPIPVFKSSF
jgi:hypothetical protein